MKLAVVTVCVSVGIAAGAPKLGGQRRGPTQEQVRRLVDSLPPESHWRRMLQDGVYGDGIHRPWMDLMQHEGVKLASFTVEFSWSKKGRQLKDWTITREEFFRDYDAPEPITDAQELDRIRTSGLQYQLEVAALAVARTTPWVDHPWRRHGSGFTSVFLADNEWLPVAMSKWLIQFEPGTTPLMHAAEVGDVPRMERLLSGGANVHVVAPNGSTALHWAAASGGPRAVQALLDAGASVRANAKGHGNALFWAAANGQTESVQILLQAGADPNSKRFDGESALSIAAGKNYPEIVRVLLRAGADPNSKSLKGETALSVATRKHYADILQILKQAGARE